MKTEKLSQIKPPHFRYAIDDLRGCRGCGEFCGQFVLVAGESARGLAHSKTLARSSCATASSCRGLFGRIRPNPSKSNQTIDKHAGEPSALRWLSAGRRFHFWCKIINAHLAKMGFYRDMERRGEQPGHLPACAGGGFGVLIQITNQHGAGL